MRSERVAMLGPFTPSALEPWIPSLRTGAPAGTGGPALVGLVRARLERGLSTDVITVDPGLQQNAWYAEGGLARIWVIRGRRRRAVRDAFRDERKGLLAALRTTDADVCHAHWAYEYGLAGVLQNVMPVVVTLHDHPLRVLWRNGASHLGLCAIACFVVRRARVMTAVAPHVARLAGRLSGYAVRVVPNLVDVPGGAWERRSGVVVAALDWSPLKNVRNALRAFAAVRERCPGTVLRLMGRGLEGAGAAAAWARARGLSDGVEWLGPVGRGRALEEIAGASVLFHPSLEEAMPGPVAEAMALGTPVVAARQAAGSAWLLDAGSAGTLCAGTSPGAMADAICDALAAGSQQRVSAARTRIGQLADPETVLAAYAVAYEDARARGVM